MHIAGTTLLLGLRYRDQKAADPGGCSRAALRVITSGTPPRTSQRVCPKKLACTRLSSHNRHLSAAFRQFLSLASIAKTCLHLSRVAELDGTARL